MALAPVSVASFTCYLGRVVDKLPELLVSRFAVAARDVLWFKPKVMAVFERAGVPRAIMIELRSRMPEPTVVLSRRGLELLEQMGEPGLRVIQRLIQEVADWDDYSHLKDGRGVGVAKTSQAELKKEIQNYANRRKYQRDKEKAGQREREARAAVSRLDHNTLQGFRDRFDRAHGLTDKQARGIELEALVNDIFDYYCPRNRGPFRRVGEQVDGHFVYGEHHYFCEIRWKAEKSSAADVSVLRDRATAAFGGDVRALFISFNGFTAECLDLLNSRGAAERVILMDGADLRTVLNADIPFDVLLDEKVVLAVRENRVFVPAGEIILSRIA